MQIIPLGGAGEVGASSAILEIAGARILIDAGVRTSSAGRKAPLPAFGLIGKAPDAVVVTHAHTDHTGALAIALQHISDAPVHMNLGTLLVLETLQLDAVRHMEKEESETPSSVSYTAEDVEALIARVVTHPYYRRFCPVPGRSDIQVEMVPCGHVFGAGMLVIDSPEGRILWTGDYSVAPQPTVGGVDLSYIEKKRAERPFDLVVTEGTYGDAEHPPRSKEESRLIKVLERATAKGGKVLIPAFAVGRSQDIGVLIRNAKLEGRLSGVAVYLDGMVRGITSIYQNFLHEIYPGRTEPVQILDPDLQIFRANSTSRAKLISGEFEGPAIVVASSGMLIGGQSVRYARAFMNVRGNAVLVTGYQDEESPGRALLNLKRGGKLRLSDGGPPIRVRSFVGRYQLSAHADATQVAAVLDAAGARKVALVHGDPPSLKALSKYLKARRVTILANGTPLKLAKNQAPWTPPIVEATDFCKSVGDAAGVTSTGLRLPDARAVRNLWQVLVQQGQRHYAEHEICRMFLGHAYTSAEREALSRILSDHRLYFQTGSATGQRAYRPRPMDEVRDLLVERANGYQIPVKKGDIVTYTDGSTDTFLAIVDQVQGEDVTGIIAGSSRQKFRREWLRAVAVPAREADEGDSVIFDARRMLSGHRGRCTRWLEDLLRDARSLPQLNVPAAFFAAEQTSDRTISVEESLPVFYGEFTSLKDVHRIAAALALSGASSFFTVQPDGRFRARERDDVQSRNTAFLALCYVASLLPGTPVHMEGGQQLVFTGEWGAQSFEAKRADGSVVRCNYRKLVLRQD